MTADAYDLVPVDLVDADPDQPRRWFDPVKLDELTASITANGMVSPIRVRPAGDRYVLVHGERRLRAARQAGWARIPAVVTASIAPADVRWHQLVENVNRADLTPVEEAQAYAAAVDTGSTHAEVAARIGRTRSYVTQKLRVLELPPAVLLLLSRGALTEGHARQLLKLKALYTDAHTVDREVKVSRDTLTVESVREMWDDTTTDSARAALTFVALRSCRPLDWPLGYPFDSTGHPVLADAAREHFLTAAEAPYPKWWDAAYWYGSLAVRYGLSVHRLSDTLAGFTEHLLSAVAWWTFPEPTSSRDAVALWWEYRSDLRHAGLADDHRHLADEAAALLEREDEDGLALPSARQPWARRIVESGTTELVPAGAIQ